MPDEVSADFDRRVRAVLSVARLICGSLLGLQLLLAATAWIILSDSTGVAGADWPFMGMMSLLAAVMLVIAVWWVRFAPWRLQRPDRPMAATYAGACCQAAVAIGGAVFIGLITAINTRLLWPLVIIDVASIPVWLLVWPRRAALDALVEGAAVPES